jgi:hypothetical protein
MGASPRRSRAAWAHYVRNGAQTELPILMEVLDTIPSWASTGTLTGQ